MIFSKFLCKFKRREKYHQFRIQHTVVDNQSPQIGYLGGKLMYQQDFFRIELQISKDIEKAPSEVFPTSS